MKLQSLSKQLFLLFLIPFCCFSCYEDRCFDVQKISEYRKEAREWILPMDESNFKLKSDSNTFDVVQRDGFSSGVSESDDCGRTFVGFDKVISVNTPSHFSDFQFHIVANGENDYYFALETESINPKKITYSFVSNSVLESHAEAEILFDFEIDKIVYSEIMHFEFLDAPNPKELKEVFYAKGIGVVKFTTENGSEFISDY